jgi:flagellar protein FliL
MDIEQQAPEESAEESREESAEQPQDASSKKSSLRLFLMIGAALLLLAGAGGFLFSRRAKAATPKPAEDPPAEAKVEIKSVLHLETFTVNMADPEQKTYLRIGIDLGMGSVPKGEGKASAPTALVRDTILEVLMAAKPDDVTSPEGKAQLKQRLLDALQQRAPELDVREIYFTEFLMQR